MDIESSHISKEELVKQILSQGEGEKFSNLEENLIHEIISEKVSKNINSVHENSLSFGDRCADKIADFGGSWKFIISFMVILVLWFVLNGYILKHPFDAYPFIFLNLILSCLAAVQAPIIMMSQNRQEEKDRMRANNDFKVNFKSEIIVENLHRKIDDLIDTKAEVEELDRKFKEMEKKQDQIIKILEGLQK